MGIGAATKQFIEIAKGCVVGGQVQMVLQNLFLQTQL